MKVRFKTCVAGVGWCYLPYTQTVPREYEIDDKLAQHYIKHGMAVMVEPPQPEQATAKPLIEKRVRRSRRKTGGQ